MCGQPEDDDGRYKLTDPLSSEPELLVSAQDDDVMQLDDQPPLLHQEGEIGGWGGWSDTTDFFSDIV